MIAGDINEDIKSTNIEQFLITNRIYKIHQCINLIMNRRDSTYKEGSKLLDLIAASEVILQHITECKLIDYNKIILTDHCRFLIHIDINTYFEVISLNIQSINYSKLDSTRKCHR